MSQSTIEEEVNEFLFAHDSRRDEAGNRLVVRNRYLPGREVVTGAGKLHVDQPRVRDNSSDVESRARFISKMLPPYLRKSRTIGELVPWLYLKGISTGDFSEALEQLLGESARSFSANVVTRLKEQWGAEYDGWQHRDSSDKTYVLVWADGIDVNFRLENPENKKQCLLVLIGATAEGKKGLIAVVDGFRESEQSWYELLIDLKQRGLENSPKLAVGDGALGFWAEIPKVFPDTREQRCWVHKTANILNKMPRSFQPKAKGAIHQIWMSETREDGHKAFDAFLEKYQAKYLAACECLSKDRDVLLEFYDFPAEHWSNLRTTNPIESTFATIRLRLRRTKGCGTRRASLTMMFKLDQAPQKKWRRLNGYELIIPLMDGKKLVNGIMQDAA